MSRESAPADPQQPQPGQPLPGDQMRRHPIFGDDLDDPSVYGADVPESEWLTGSHAVQPEEPIHTVDSIVAEHEAEQREAERRREPGLVRRALGRIASLGATVAEYLPTEADARHARHHVHEVLEHAVFNWRGVPDGPERKIKRNLGSNPEVTALDLTVQWIQTHRALKGAPKKDPHAEETKDTHAEETQYKPSNDRNAEEIRHGIEYVVHARRSIATAEEQQQLADARWNSLLDPANVRALRQRVMALSASPNAMGQGNEATRAHKQHQTNQHLADTGIKGIRPERLLADYLGIKPEMLWTTERGDAPKAVLDELDFLVKLDSRPLDSHGTTALDYLLPFDDQERNVQLAAARRYVDTRLLGFEERFDDGEYPGTVDQAPADRMRQRMRGMREGPGRGFPRSPRESVEATPGEEVDEEAGIYTPGEDETSRALDTLLWRRALTQQSYMALSTDEKSGAKGQGMKRTMDELDAKIQSIRR